MNPSPPEPYRTPTQSEDPLPGELPTNAGQFRETGNVPPAGIPECLRKQDNGLEGLRPKTDFAYRLVALRTAGPSTAGGAHRELPLPRAKKERAHERIERKQH